MEMLRDFKNPLLIPLVGLAFWTGTTYMLVVKNEKELHEQRRTIDKLESERATIQNKIGKIEGKLDTIITLLQDRD